MGTRSLCRRHAPDAAHNLDRRFISWGAAGWHISFDFLERLLAGESLGRIVGAEAMKFAAWQRLVAEYAKQFGVETQLAVSGSSKAVN